MRQPVTVKHEFCFWFPFRISLPKSFGEQLHTAALRYPIRNDLS